MVRNRQIRDRAARAARDITVAQDDEGFVLKNTPPESVTQQFAVQEIPEVDVTQDMLSQTAENPESWLTYGGGYNQQRHTTADVITTDNVSNLSMEYIIQTGTLSGEMEGTPIVVPGDPPIMYQTNGPNHMKAINARTGAKLWSYTYSNPSDLRVCCGLNNRGAAVLGDTVYMSTLDAGLVAVDRYNGEEKWYYNAADYTDGYSNTAAPIAYNNRILLGSAGGEYGIRGYFDAVSSEGPNRIWRRWMTPEDMWVGNTHEFGGSTSWMSATVDPDTNTIYAPTSNAGPDYDGTVRPGPNPYTTGTVAIDADSGEVNWYHQESPHGWWDYDSASPPVLFEGEVDGEQRKLVSSAGKTGWVWTYDAESGKLVERSDEFVQHINMWKLPSKNQEETPMFQPTWAGGTDWQPCAYDPNAGLIIVKGTNHPGKLTWQPEEYKDGAYWTAGDWSMLPLTADVLQHGPEEREQQEAQEDPQVQPPEEWNRNVGNISAVDPVSGDVVWQEWHNEYQWGSSLTTVTGVTFYGTGEGYLVAVDTESGDRLWEFNLGASINGEPMSWYDPGTGKQYVAVQAGGGGLGPSDQGDTVGVFALEEGGE